VSIGVARRNIALCVILVTLWAMHFSVAITVAFYELHKLNQSQILSLVAVMSIMTVIWEIPSGFLSDKIGDRQAILLSTVAQTVAATALGWWATSYWEFALTNGTIGFAWALSSGSDRSLVNKTASQEQTVSYSFYVAQARAGGALAGLAIGSGAIAYGDVTLPLKLQPITFVAAFFVALALKETHSHRTHVHLGQIKEVWNRIFIEHQHLKWLVLLAALVNASALASMWMAQPDLRAAGVNIEWFGAVFAVRATATFAVASFKDRWTIRLGTVRTQATLVLAVSSAAWFAALPTSWTGTVAILAANAVTAALTDALLTNAVNQHMKDIKHASTTSYSIISALQALLFIPISLGLGPISDTVSPNLALLAIAAVTLLPGWCMLRRLRRSLPKT